MILSSSTSCTPSFPNQAPTLMTSCNYMNMQCSLISMPLDRLANTSSPSVQVRAHMWNQTLAQNLPLSSCITFDKLFDPCSSVSPTIKLTKILLKLNEIINIKVLSQCFHIHRKCSINGSYSLLTLVLPART